VASDIEHRAHHLALIKQHCRNGINNNSVNKPAVHWHAHRADKRVVAASSRSQTHSRCTASLRASSRTQRGVSSLIDARA